MKKTLPTFYYLDHFKEFLSYFEGQNGTLLTEKATAFIDKFHRLPDNAQALIGRIANRKHSVIPLKTLQYEEIDNINHVLKELEAEKWIGRINKASNHQLAESLPKADLLCMLEELNIQTPAKNIKKANLNDYFCQHLNDTHKLQLANFPIVVRLFDDELKYLLFIYFGNLRGKLNQFSMRDLGVMRTRADAVTGEARFESRSDATAAFQYARWRESIASSLLLTPPPLDNLPTVTSAEGQRIKQSFLYEAGNYFLNKYRQWALEAWHLSEHDTATERWIREQYKDNNIDAVESALKTLIDGGSSEALLVFAEDFYARKFKQKRTSVLTDLLRDSTRCLNIDSRYNTMVEKGVTAYYSRAGMTAIRTENHLWRSLFGLLYWPILYEQDKANLSNEFERVPHSLKTNRFYDEHKDMIEDTLRSIPCSQSLYKLLVKHCTTYYGKANAIFMWRSHLLEHLKVLLDNCQLSSILEYLKAMAMDYVNLKDGYPDIMVLENNHLRFEEIKAPGDSLRRNQLVTLQKLKQHGFDVHITQVNWVRDPEQIYAVVDIETTGGRAEHHRITEIGIVKMQGTRVIDRWQSLVNPQRRIPKAITQLTGISNETVENAPLFCDIADDVDAFTQDAIFVAHNVNFDLGFIKQEFARLDRYYRRPKLCTVQQCRKAFPKLSSYSLANLCAHFNIEMDRHHRALSDADAAAELLCLILKNE
jgi:DNA polymerase-3 subunit epsilon